MSKVISVPLLGSGFSAATARRTDAKPPSWIARGLVAFLAMAAASVLWAIAWMLALSD